jgi:hypothetical protein
MPSHCYPDLYGRADLSWSGGFSRFVRTLRLVAIAGIIGAAGGGLGVLAITGAGSPRQDVFAEPANIPANAATHPVSSEPSRPKAAAPPNAPAVAALASEPVSPSFAAPAEAPVHSAEAPTRVAEAPTHVAEAPAHSAHAATRAAQGNEPALGHVYDRAEPARSGADTAHPSSLARARARIHARRRSAARKPTTIQPPQIQPPQGPAFSEYRGDGGWRYGFLGGYDWRY